MSRITVVGGGLGGLTAAISCAEAGHQVRLLEAHEQLGGRARSMDAPYQANVGPHVIYKDGGLWRWLRERDLLPPYAGLPLAPVRFRYQGKARRMPPLGSAPSVLRPPASGPSTTTPGSSRPPSSGRTRSASCSARRRPPAT
jgi:choline dehydrogenase-like flavoprotein